MNRVWLLVLAAIAALLLVTPLLVGIIARDHIEWALWAVAGEADKGIGVVYEAHERNWLNTSNRVRFDIRDEWLADFAAAATGNSTQDDTVSVIAETEIHHGLFPVSALKTDADYRSFVLAVAETRVTVLIDDANSLRLPLVVNTTIGVSGAGRSSVVLDPGGIDVDNAPMTVSWDGARFDLVYGRDPAGFGVSGSAGDIRLRFVDESIALEAVLGTTRISGDTRNLEGGSASRWLHELESIAVSVNGSNVLETGEIRFVHDTDTKGDLSDHRVEWTLTTLESAMANVEAITFKGGLSDFHQSAFGDVFGEAEKAGFFGDDADLDVVDYVIRQVGDELRSLIAAGPRLTVEELSIVSDAGSAAMSLDLKFSGARSTDDIRLDETLLDRLELSASLRADDRALATAAELDPILGQSLAQMTQQGTLVRNGDTWTLEAGFTDGVGVLNGQRVFPPAGM